jgi:hypothetical protein
VFSRPSDSEADLSVTLQLCWVPPDAVWLDLQEAQDVVARLMSRAFALQIAALYPADTPDAVERKLAEAGLLIGAEDNRRRLLERMARRGMPMLRLAAANGPLDNESTMEALIQALPPTFRSLFAKLLRQHECFVGLLTDSIWRLLDPRPLSAATLADFASDAETKGAPEGLLCRLDDGLANSDRYELLIRMAHQTQTGRRNLALRCALVELRHAELIGDLARYETCLRLIPDLTSRQVAGDPLLDALTGSERAGVRSGTVSSWFLNDGQRRKLMHIEEYIAAAFGRVNLAKSVRSRYGEYCKAHGLDFDWPPEDWLRSAGWRQGRG